MKFKKIVLIVLGIILLIVIGFFSYVYFFQEATSSPQGFETDSLSLKVAMKEQATALNTIKITNIDSAEYFVVLVTEIEDLVSVEKSFNLDVGDSYDLVVNFRTNNNPAGVYLGELEISSGKETKKIPIVLEIQTEEVLFDSNVEIYPKGKDVVLGQKLNAEITIFDLTSIGRSTVEVSYFVKDYSGNTFVSESEDKIVDGKAEYSKTFDTSELEMGEYVFVALVEYGNSIGTSSISFKVGEKEKEEFFGGNINLMVGLFAFFFLIFLGLFIYSLFFRDKLLTELQNQYKKEIRKQKQIIESQGQIGYGQLGTSVEKRLYSKELKKVAKQRIAGLKKIHQARLKIFNKLKLKSPAQLKKQLAKWKSKGYNTKLLEKRYKLPSIMEIKKKIKKWKAQGYDTSLLEKS